LSCPWSRSNSISTRFADLVAVLLSDRVSAAETSAFGTPSTRWLETGDSTGTNDSGKPSTRWLGTGDNTATNDSGKLSTRWLGTGDNTATNDSGKPSTRWLGTGDNAATNDSGKPSTRWRSLCRISSLRSDRADRATPFAHGYAVRVSETLPMVASRCQRHRVSPFQSSRNETASLPFPGSRPVRRSRPRRSGQEACSAPLRRGTGEEWGDNNAVAVLSPGG